MKKIILVGAGKIGAVISEFLAASGDYSIAVADVSDASLASLPGHEAITTLRVDVTNHDALTNAIRGHFAVINALPFRLTAAVARAAAAAGVHYLDLTEDVASTRVVRTLAEKSDCAFIPQSGLAPGFITMVTYDLTRNFENLQNVHMRVGALPRYPSNALKYNITWSVEGLINEYCEPCEAIVEGELNLLAEGTLPQRGLIRQEDIPFDAFIRNRFGCNFARETLTEIAA